MQQAIPGAIARAPGLTLAAVAYLLPLAPLGVMIWPLWRQPPGLQAAAGNVLGFGAVLCLLACLAVTPVTAATGMRKTAQWRRHFGLCVFVLGLAGLVIAATGRGAMPGAMAWQAAGHARQWTGTVIVALLIPLAATSSTLAQKTLGAHWKTWQRRLTWAVWAAITIHLLLLGQLAVITAWVLASAPLTAARLPAARSGLASWRRGGHAGLRLWVVTGIATGMFAAGSGTLLCMEVAAVAGLYRFT